MNILLISRKLGKIPSERGSKKRGRRPSSVDEAHVVVPVPVLTRVRVVVVPAVCLGHLVVAHDTAFAVTVGDAGDALFRDVVLVTEPPNEFGETPVLGVRKAAAHVAAVLDTDGVVVVPRNAARVPRLVDVADGLVLVAVVADGVVSTDVGVGVLEPVDRTFGRTLRDADDDGVDLRRAAVVCGVVAGGGRFPVDRGLRRRGTGRECGRTDSDCTCCTIFFNRLRLDGMTYF